jgi:hypothetical protein
MFSINPRIIRSNTFPWGKYIPAVIHRATVAPEQSEIVFYMTSSADRARLLIKKLGPKKASEMGNGDHDRWKSVSKGAVRVSTDEIDVLVKVYPQYALWLSSGQIAPEIGQTSPDYDEANRNLNKPNAG